MLTDANVFDTEPEIDWADVAAAFRAPLARRVRTLRRQLRLGDSDALEPGATLPSAYAAIRAPLVRNCCVEDQFQMLVYWEALVVCVTIKSKGQIKSIKKQASFVYPKSLIYNSKLYCFFFLFFFLNHC